MMINKLCQAKKKAVIEIRNNANFHWGLTMEKLEPRPGDKKEEHKEVLKARNVK